MAIGNKIKRIRNLRGLTQKEFGRLIGFDEKTADVRVAQYESGTRTPKADLLRKMAEILDVNICYLFEPSLYSAEEIMFALFELDDNYPIKILDTPNEKHSVCFDSVLMDSFLAEWQTRKQELADGIITPEEYLEWKINFPKTADDCGKHEPSKKWKD
ncbi:MAG: helix-turn-helix domain-containing protein [Ruminococcus sp.]|nr:helix-turn-helix domain-containing protein [Ruminococcus sp.]MDE6785122.1 helix-turn-helix domain-containing protein [Ruminococcus sp.]